MRKNKPYLKNDLIQTVAVKVGLEAKPKSLLDHAKAMLKINGERNKRHIINLLHKKVIWAKGKQHKLQQQLNKITAALTKLTKQIEQLHKTLASEPNNINAQQQLNNVTNQFTLTFRKLQHLIEAIILNFAGDIGGNATAELQMLITAHETPTAIYTAVLEKLTELLQEEPPPYRNIYESIADIVSNLLIGLLGFFITDLETLDEEVKKELQKALQAHLQKQKHANNRYNQIQLLINAIFLPHYKRVIANFAQKFGLTQKATNQATPPLPTETIFFPSPLKLRPTPGGGSSTKEEQ
jgi:hypothetical protein